MALYNKWQNENCFKIFNELNDEKLYLDIRNVFNSTLITLNYIIDVDKTIYYFIHTKNFTNFDSKFIPYPEYGELRSTRFEFDEKLIQESQRYSQY